MKQKIKLYKNAKDIQMRHEEKYICSETYLQILESRLKCILNPDENQGENGYEIKSIYLDTSTDRFFEEGLQGLEYRNKYRIRTYNNNSDVIKLEKKTSFRNKKAKSTEKLTVNDVQKILRQDDLGDFFEYEEDSLMREFLCLQKTELMRPKNMIRYDRKAYVSDIGNIRITLDRNICVSERMEEFFEDDTVWFPILPQGVHVLEVKYDGIFPGYLSRMINFEGLERISFSKYVLGRAVMKNNGRM